MKLLVFTSKYGVDLGKYVNHEISGDRIILSGKKGSASINANHTMAIFYFKKPLLEIVLGFVLLLFGYALYSPREGITIPETITNIIDVQTLGFLLMFIGIILILHWLSKPTGLNILLSGRTIFVLRASTKKCEEILSDFYKITLAEESLEVEL